MPAVRLRDLVVHWAVEGGGTGPVGVGVLVGEVGVALVAELDEEGEHPVGALVGQLHVLVPLALAVTVIVAVALAVAGAVPPARPRRGVARGALGLADLHDLAAPALFDLGVALQHEVDGPGLQLATLRLERVGQLVGGGEVDRDGRCRARRRCRGSGRSQCPDGGEPERRGAQDPEQLSHVVHF